MAEYQIELANQIRGGRAVGNQYVVTRRPSGRTSILYRAGTRDEAERWTAAQTYYLVTIDDPDGRPIEERQERYRREGDAHRRAAALREQIASRGWAFTVRVTGEEG